MINVRFDDDQTFKQSLTICEFQDRPIFRAFCDRCLSAVPLVRIVARWKLEATENGGMWNYVRFEIIVGWFCGDRYDDCHDFGCGFSVSNISVGKASPIDDETNGSDLPRIWSHLERSEQNRP